LTREGQSHSHSVPVGYSTTVGATTRPGARTRNTISSPVRDSTATAPARARATPCDHNPERQFRRIEATRLLSAGSAAGPEGSDTASDAASDAASDGDGGADDGGDGISSALVSTRALDARRQRRQNPGPARA